MLLAGTPAAGLLEADSLRGILRGSLQQRLKSEPGPYHDLLFEEMRPGQVSIQGPDRKGDYAVIQLLERGGGRPLTFAEVEPAVDGWIREVEAARLRTELIGRHRARIPVESRPDLVMRVDFRPR